MDEFAMKLMGLTEEEITLFKTIQTFPPDVQILYRLWFTGDPQQKLDAECEIYDRLEALGHDVSELRESMRRRLETEGK